MAGVGRKRRRATALRDSTVQLLSARRRRSTTFSKANARKASAPEIGVIDERGLAHQRTDIPPPTARRRRAQNCVARQLKEPWSRFRLGTSPPSSAKRPRHRGDSSSECALPGRWCTGARPRQAILPKPMGHRQAHRRLDARAVGQFCWQWEGSQHRPSLRSRGMSMPQGPQLDYDAWGTPCSLPAGSAAGRAWRESLPPSRTRRPIFMILRASSAVATRQRPRSKRARVRSPQTVRNRKASYSSLALENPRELPGSAGEVSAWRRRQCRPFLPDRKSDLGRTPQTGHDRCARSSDDGQISRPRGAAVTGSQSVDARGFVRGDVDNRLLQMHLRSSRIA